MIVFPKAPETVNADNMSAEEISEKLREGYEDFKAGNVQNAAEAFARFKEQF